MSYKRVVVARNYVVTILVDFGPITPIVYEELIIRINKIEKKRFEQLFGKRSDYPDRTTLIVTSFNTVNKKLN